MVANCLLSLHIFRVVWKLDNFLLHIPAQDIDGNGMEQNLVSTICSSTGHFVPAQAPQRKAYTEFLEQFINKT